MQTPPSSSLLPIFILLPPLPNTHKHCLSLLSFTLSLTHTHTHTHTPSPRGAARPNHFVSLFAKLLGNKPPSWDPAPTSELYKWLQLELIFTFNPIIIVKIRHWSSILHHSPEGHLGQQACCFAFNDMWCM